nr:hypothetical protein [uncultured Azospirillum sp.]
MRTTKTLALAALLALPTTAALHAGQGVGQGAGQETKRGDALLPAPPPGWQRPDASQTGGPGAELEAGEMGVGHKSGPPAGNVLVTPNNAAAAANHNEPIGGSNATSGTSRDGSLGSGSSGMDSSREPDRKN